MTRWYMSQMVIDIVFAVQPKLQSCFMNISEWYQENQLKIKSDKSIELCFSDVNLN